MKYIREMALFAAAAVIIVISVFLLAGVHEPNERTDNSCNPADYLMMESLLEYQGDFQKILADLFELTEKTALAVSKSGLSGPETQKLLDFSISAHPGIITIGTFDKDGICTAMSPESHNITGWDLSETPVVAAMNKGMVPQMTNLFGLSEGGYAASINYPVFSSDKKYTGFVSLTFDPYTAFNETASQFMEKTGCQVMVVQKDGVVLYDTDINEVGKETFGNPMYDEFPEIAGFAQAYSGSFSGEYEYGYLDKNLSDEVRKKAVWTTIGLYGVEWRLIAICEIPAAP